MLVSLAAGALGGCRAEERVVYDGWGRFKEMGDPKASASARDAGAAQVYAIHLERFVGADRLAKAQNLAQELGKRGFPDVDIRDSAGFTSVSLGRFTDPAGRDAQAMLRRVREVEIGGNRLFTSAGFVAAGGGTRIFDPLDLQQYTNQYSLQIGFYDASFPGDRKAAAEEAARTLREEGEQAYFYHGRHRSLLTIGLFSRSDFETVNDPAGGGFTVDRYGPRVRELRKKYPYNLGNGITLIEKNKSTGEVVGELPSFLVQVR